MPPLPKNELLSAYLDGELTAGEQAQVEEWLADEPQLRRLHDELRTLRSTLQSLPCFKLPDDFSSRVQRAAEERMLSKNRTAALVESTAMPATNGQAHDAALRLDDSAASPPAPDWQERMRRPLAWSIVVVAAALLIMFLNPDKSPDGAALAPAVSSGKTAGSGGKSAAASAGNLAISSGADDQETTHTADGSASKHRQSQVPAGLAGVAIRVTPDGFAADGLLVVNCDVTAKALRDGDFRNLLKQERIGWETDDANPTVPAGDEASGKEAVRPLEVQVVYVEANAGQIERVLHHLHTQAAAFPNVALVPVPGADWQHAWQARYERHGHPTQTSDGKGSAKTIRKSGPIKGPPIDAKQPEASAPKEPPVVGRAWSIEVPTARAPSDEVEPKPAAVNDKDQTTRLVDQTAETAMLRVLFVLRVVGTN